MRFDEHAIFQGYNDSDKKGDEQVDKEQEHFFKILGRIPSEITIPVKDASGAGIS